MDNIQLHKNKLLEKISRFLKRTFLIKTLSIQVKILTGVVSVLFIFSLIESFAFFNSTIRTILALVLITSFLLPIIFYLIIIITKYFKVSLLPELNKSAIVIGDFYPQIKDNLLNALQLLENKKYNYSSSLVNAAFDKVYKQVSSFNFLEIISYTSLKKNLKLLVISIIVTIVIFVSFSSVKNGAIRLVNYDKDFIKPVEFSLQILPGNSNIKKSESIKLRVNVLGKKQDDIFISIKSISEVEFKNQKVLPDSNNKFELEIKNVKKSFRYFAYKNNVKTNEYEIKVVSPPIINSMTYELLPPKYSGLPKSEQGNNGNITALKGTVVNFKLGTTKDIQTATRKYGSNKAETLTVSKNSITGKFSIKEYDEYHFEIIDKQNSRNESPIKYSIIVIQDEFPQVELFKPELNSLLPNNDIVSLDYAVMDDYGFSKVLLMYNISEMGNANVQKFKSISLSVSHTEIKQALFYNWDMSRLSLKENEFVSFYLEVFDNDFVSGPKSAKSKLHKIRIPSLDELFTQVENVQDSAIEDITKTVEEAEELKKELHQISNELKQNEKEIKWNEKERIEKALGKFEKLSEKINDVQENLDKMQKEMNENNLLSEETMQKYNELQDLMNELNSEEMRKAMEKMQKSLEQLNRDNIQKSLDDLALNEKMFQKSIERTLNLLKKIQIEQKMDEVIKRTEKLVEDLEKLSTETKKDMDDKNQDNTNELTKDQKNINNQLENLKEELEKLQNKMSDVNDMPSKKMEELNKEFDKQENMELSKEAMEQMSKQNPEDALKNQNQLSQNMDKMKNQLQQMQKQMQQKSQQMVMQNMLKAIDNLIGLSKEQESLSEKTKSQLSQPNQLPEMVQDQMDINQNLDNIMKQLGDLAQKSFAISPEMGESLGKARNNMQKSINGLQGKNGQQSTQNQNGAMKNLNEAASLMQSALQSMMQGAGQGSGMMSLMQQLQQMAQQQMGLNKITQMLKQGQLSMQQMAQLQRLAQQQGSIQKSLSELNKEARESGKSKKVTANLEKILSDMKEVVSGLNTKKLDDNLIRKQEKILSKLIDAQRSINERDFEKNRESFSGKNFNLESPEELYLSGKKAQDLLKQELLKSIKEGYSKDYEDLIKRYFESLNDSTIRN